MITSVEGAKSAFLQGVVSEITDLLKSLWSNFDTFHAMTHHTRIGRYISIQPKSMEAYLARQKVL